MKELIGFLEELDTSVLLKSCIFHYEFEYIHPFSDGNGRLGRLWQTIMLAQWRPVFVNLPVESYTRDHQAEYYDAFNRANKQTRSGIFVEFMLELIYETLLNMDDFVEPPVTASVTPPVEKLLFLLDKKGALSNQEILSEFGLKDRRRMRETYISPAMDLSFIEYTIQDKPNSSYQKYRLARLGQAWLNNRRNS